MSAAAGGGVDVLAVMAASAARERLDDNGHHAVRMEKARAAVEAMAVALDGLLRAASLSAAHGKPFAVDSPGIVAARAALDHFHGRTES